MLTDEVEGCQDYDILGERYPLPLHDNESQTKEQILLNATLYFARKGYAAVSMRDIAKTIGIKPASLYNHFDSKEALWREVLAHAKALYLLYFDQLDEALANAESFEEVLDVIFHEPKRMANVFTCYAFSMVQAEQFWDEYAAEIFTDTFLKYSIDFFSERFDGCIARGVARKFDTRTAATIIMHSVLIGLEIKVQEWLGRFTPYNPSLMLCDLQRFILDAAAPRPQSGAGNSVTP